jgi:hypothetical protein
MDSFIENMAEWKKYYSDLHDEKNNQLAEFSTGENNEAVKTIFGFSKDDSTGSRGKAMMSDVYLNINKTQSKVFDHLAVDRFTGGGIEGALFQEKVVAGEEFVIDVFIEKDALENETIKQAFENTLNDITSGMLPLGGGINKGHGCFKGKYEIIEK